MNESMKACSICGVSFALSEYNYRSRDDRSYCRSCDKAVTAAHAIGGKEAARAFREDMRKKWRQR